MYYNSSSYVNGCMWLKYWKRFLEIDVTVKQLVMFSTGIQSLLVISDFAVNFPVYLGYIIE